MTTPRTYYIRAVADFAAVPPDRRAACLQEFQTWLRIADAAPGFNLRAVAFTWIDDGADNITLRMERAP